MTVSWLADAEAKVIEPADPPGPAPARNTAQTRRAGTVAALATSEDLAAYLGHPPENPAQAGFMLDAAGGRLLAVPTLHLVSVASVLVRGVERVDEVEASAAGLLYLQAGWPTGYNAVVVRAEHGYDQTPRDMLAAVCALASRMLATPGAGPITGYRIGGVQISYGPGGAESIGLTQTEQTALTRYRLVGIAPAR